MLNQNTDQMEESEPRDGDEEDDIPSVGSKQSEDTEKGMNIDTPPVTQKENQREKENISRRISNSRFKKDPFHFSKRNTKSGH